MAFSEEDRIVIQYLRQSQNYSANCFLREFPNKGWKLGGLNDLLRKIDKTGSCIRRVGSGMPRTARTYENIGLVQDLVLSQEDRSQTHLTQREISREVGIYQTSVIEIVKFDLRLKCFKKRRATKLMEFNKHLRLVLSKLLTRSSANLVNFIWFTDEKLFTVASPFTSQRDCLYAAVGSLKKNIPVSRLLRTRSTFSN